MYVKTCIEPCDVYVCMYVCMYVKTLILGEEKATCLIHSHVCKHVTSFFFHFRVCSFRVCSFRVCSFRVCSFRVCSFRVCSFRVCSRGACVTYVRIRHLHTHTRLHRHTRRQTTEYSGNSSLRRVKPSGTKKNHTRKQYTHIDI